MVRVTGPLALQRRRLLLGLARGFAVLPWLATAAACNGTPRPEPPERRLLVIAPWSYERTQRTDAWNRRFFDVTRVKLAHAPVSGPDEAAARATSAAALAELQAMAPNAGQLALVDLQDIPALAHQARLRVIGDLARQDRYDLKRFMPQGLQPGFGPDGQLYALPQEVDARQLYFNHQHVAEAGIDVRRAGLHFEDPIMTWETFRQVTLDLVSSPRARERVAFSHDHEGVPLEVWGWQNGAEGLSRDGRRATFTRPELVEALAWQAASAREIGDRPLAPGTFPPVARGMPSTDRPAKHPFLTGRVSTCVETVRLVNTIADWDIQFPFGYVEQPRRRWEATPVNLGNAWGFVALRGSDDAAWAAMKFLVSRDAAIIDAAWLVAQASLAGPVSGPSDPNQPIPGRRLWLPPFTGQLKVDRELAERYRTGSKRIDEARDHGLEQLRHARARPASLIPGEIWPLLQEARRQVLFAGRAPRDALADMEREAQRRLDRAWSAAAS